MAASLIAEKAVERCGIMLPPGLAPPPGLELPCTEPESLAPPPGLEQKPDESSLSPMYVSSPLCPPASGITVQITSLPNHLLSDAMMNATLEQAKLDKFVLRIVTKPGVHRGDALLTFTTMDAGIRCSRHFHGRRWDASGVMVNAWLLPEKAPKKSRPTKPKPSFTLSAEAPVFVPGAWAAPCKETPATETPTTGSDVSTEDGDSAASSDEKEGAAY